MDVLLDTHILIWALYEKEKLAANVQDLITSGRHKIYYSVLSIVEIEIKRLAHPQQMPFKGEHLVKLCRDLNFIQMPLKIPHILELKNLQRPENVPPHKDPFDKLMLCQAIVEGMKFMTHDSRIAEYSTDCVYKV